MQSFNLLLNKILLLLFGAFSLIFGGFSLVIIGIIILLGQNILIWFVLSIFCGFLPLALGFKLINQFNKIARLDYQKHHLLDTNPNLTQNSQTQNARINAQFSQQTKQNTQFLQNEKVYLNNLTGFFGKPNTQNMNQETHLHEVFYELLERRNGYLTVLNLAMEAKVSGKVASLFLNQKSKEFNHQIIVDNDGGMAYKFEYLTQKEIENLTKEG